MGIPVQEKRSERSSWLYRLFFGSRGGVEAGRFEGFWRRLFGDEPGAVSGILISGRGLSLSWPHRKHRHNLNVFYVEDCSSVGSGHEPNKPA